MLKRKSPEGGTGMCLTLTLPLTSHHILTFKCQLPAYKARHVGRPFWLHDCRRTTGMAFHNTRADDLGFGVQFSD